MNFLQSIIFVLLLNFFSVSFAAPVVSNLVNPARYFLDHEKEITDLSNRLELYNIAGVVGFSGMGKTELARKYAYKNQGKYDIIWFFDCNSDLNDQFVSLSKNINGSLCGNKGCGLSEDPEKAKKSVLEFLSPKKNWLLVFDNLRINQNSTVADIIKWGHNGHLIICSQDAKDLPNSVRVPHLSDNDATDVAENVLEKKNPETIQELVKIAKGYPILIVQGAMFLNENQNLTVADYKKIISASDDKMRSHIEMVLELLSNDAKDLLYKIAVINNQQFSRNLLQGIAKSDNFPKALESIARFGLINNTYLDEDNQVFEMHDAIKEAILKNMGSEKAKNIVTEVIERVNNLIPQGEGQAILALTKDSSLKSNLETLLNNAEKYEVDIYKDMELRKNLIAGYLSSADYYNCQKMADWLINRQEKFDSFITLFLMSDKQKAIYSEYLAVIGEYFDFAKSDFVTTIVYLTKAADVIKNVKNYYEVKFLIYSQLAQTYVYTGDVKNCEQNLKVAENIVKDNNHGGLDVPLLWFIRAKSGLMKGEYKDATRLINESIKAGTLSNLPEETFYSITLRTLKAEILNYMGNFKGAYEIAKKAYEQAKNVIKGDHEFHARVLAQLAWAEFGLGMKEEAAKHITESIRIFEDNDTIIGDNVSANSLNTDLAAAYVVQGNILSALGKDHKEIMDSYGIARRIYYNRYDENLFLVDDIKRFYFDAAENLCSISTDKDLLEKIIYTEFRDKIVEYWGNDPKTRKILQLEKVRNCRVLPQQASTF